MKHLNLLFLFFLLVGCKTEEDKFPEMAFFEPNMESIFAFEELSNVPTFYRECEEFVFLKTSESLYIYNKNSKQLIKKIAVPNFHNVEIMANGSVYKVDKPSKTAYKYASPRFNQEQLPYITDFDDDENFTDIRQNPEKYIEKNNLESQHLNEYISEVQGKYLAAKYLKEDIKCGIHLSYADHLILRYDTKEICVPRNYFVKGIFDKKIGKFNDCDLASETTSLPKDNSLKYIDKAILDYSLSGSNHIALGVDFDELYYYELTLADKSIKFKNPYPITNIVNFDDDIIIESNRNFYKVSIKNN